MDECLATMGWLFLYYPLSQTSDMTHANNSMQKT